MERTNLAKKQIDLIRESICVEAKCMECRELFKSGTLCFEVIEGFIDDRGNSCLFRLKEMCHDLFRNSDEATFKEKIYDITVGYIFHEAMKFRENLYQLEYYGPRYESAVREFTEQDRKAVREIETLVSKAERRMREGLREIMLLLNQLVGQMKDLMKLYKDNYLLPRFIIENEKTLLRIYGRKGMAELLNDLYHDGRQKLVVKAAESYLQSEYYDHARILFKRAARQNPKDKRANYLYCLASAFYFFYKNRYVRARLFVEAAQKMDREVMAGEDYRKDLNRLKVDLERELKKLKKVY